MIYPVGWYTQPPAPAHQPTPFAWSPAPAPAPAPAMPPPAPAPAPPAGPQPACHKDTKRDRSRSRHREQRYDERERTRSRSPDRAPRRDRSRGRTNGDYRSRDYDEGYENNDNRKSAPRGRDDRQSQEMATNTKPESSQQDHRVYVGNLSYDVKWHHLKDYMRSGITAGEVVFADVLLLPNGMSKGCGIVEYATREQAQDAINTLSNTNLMGRLVYVREAGFPNQRNRDRETEPRFNQPGGGAGGGRGGFDGGRGGMRGGFNGGGFGRGGSMSMGMGMGGRGGMGGNQIFISNLPYQVGWQDLKDLFRGAINVGNILRADVHSTPDGHPKGSGIVAFDNPEDAQNAINQFNGYDWQGRILEVREDRYAGGSGRGGFGGGFRGGFQGGYGGGGYPPRGGFGGGFGGGRGGFGGGYGGRGGFQGGGFGGGQGGGYQGGGHGGGYQGAPSAAANSAPSNPFVDFAASGGPESTTIFVRNLPWSTSNDDLDELFRTIGKVERAEIKMESNMRSSGTGVVEFREQADAAEAITKFTGYEYGGRPLGLGYVRYTNQTGGMEGMEPTGSMQAEIM
ncbi:g-strand binding protein [Recurvomyces mirabilis]|uniref:g-strand binding protein n=1 Tax=Recurvomyces mirabilis TaxID=574656 RepID=UPI002DE02ABC|nr:g-strand binding protein [Recurvomyces mirabilis]